MSAAKPYRPSNGTEGEQFFAHFCDRCERESEDECLIMTKSFVYLIEHPEYPTEWIEDEKGPRCTAFEERGAKERAEQAAFDARQATLRFGGAENGGAP